MPKILRPGDERDILAAKFELEKTETFHTENLYEWMHDYMEEEDWIDTFPIGGGDFEHYYWQQETQDGKLNQRIWWRAQKFPVKSDYFRWVICINFRNLKASKVQVVHEGKKVETWNGNLTFLIEAWLQLDYKNKWRDHWFLKHFDAFYRKRIWNKKMHKWKKDLWREAYEFAGWIKQYLEMKVPFEQPEIFHPAGGIKQNPEPPE